MQDLNFILGLYFVEVTIELELVLFFIFGWRRDERKGKADIVSILALYFLCLAIGRMILIIYDFQFTSNAFLYLAGVGISLLGMIFFIYLAEIIIPKNTHYIFTILAVATLCSIFFVNIPTSKNILYAMIPFIFLMGFAFLGYLIRRTIGSVRKNFVLLFSGQLFFGFGQGFNTDWIRDWFTNEVNFDIQPIALILIISGLGLVALAFWRLPSFNEISWHAGILSLYVITNEHGLCCVYYPFRRDAERQMAPQLVSGGVTGIISLIKEMTQSKKHLKEIDHEDIKILFEYGIYTTTALLAEKDLQIYHDKLKQFKDEFETKFKQNFIKWTGSIAEFEPAIKIVARIFEQNINELKSTGDITTCNGTS